MADDTRWISHPVFEHPVPVPANFALYNIPIHFAVGIDHGTADKAIVTVGRIMPDGSMRFWGFNADDFNARFTRRRNPWN